MFEGQGTHWVRAMRPIAVTEAPVTSVPVLLSGLKRWVNFGI
jgi:hypothetical protein